MKGLRGFLVRLAAVAFVSAGVGCATVSDIGASVGEATGTLSAEQADSIRRVGTALEASWQTITPEQEYFIGRSVAATVLATYEPLNAPAATTYLNTLGQALAMASEVPETYAGYRFLILDSDEINAFAAPGGFVFVSRGMLRLCATEDELAAVLAHEIGHVENRHGLRAIKASRWTSAGMTLLTEAGRSFSSEEVAQLTETFGDSVSDITQTLMTSGYSRGQEREADRAAVRILTRTGYEPTALIAMLEEMDVRLEPGGLDFAKTHPPPRSRISEIERLPQMRYAGQPATAERQARFERALAGVL